MHWTPATEQPLSPCSTPVSLDCCATALWLWPFYWNYPRDESPRGGGRRRSRVGVEQRPGASLSPIRVQICPCPTLSLRNVPLSFALSACDQISRLTHWWIFNNQLIQIILMRNINAPPGNWITMYLSESEPDIYAVTDFFYSCHCRGKRLWRWRTASSVAIFTFRRKERPGPGFGLLWPGRSRWCCTCRAVDRWNNLDLMVERCRAPSHNSCLQAQSRGPSLGPRRHYDHP